MKTLQKLLKAPFLGVIWLYQRTLSFDHGPLKVFFPHGYCQFHPSCSQYAFDAIQKHGVLKGTILGVWRIVRCNPWAKGGDDPVSDKFKLSKFEKR
jgi:putative membrane protein insertion efficiency factor